MRTLFLKALLAAPAFADIIPEEVATCRNKAAGSGCTTGEGHAGTCIETSISRPDYSGGRLHLKNKRFKAADRESSAVKEAQSWGSKTGATKSSVAVSGDGRG